MEVVTIHESLRVAKEMRWRNIVIESVSQVVIQQIREVSTQWRMNAIILNIVALANQIEQVQ